MIMCEEGKRYASFLEDSMRQGATMDEDRDRVIDNMIYYAAISLYYDPAALAQDDVTVTDLSVLGPFPEGVSQRYSILIGEFACIVSLTDRGYMVKIDNSSAWRKEELDLRRAVLKAALEHWGYGPYSSIRHMLDAMQAEADAGKTTPIINEQEQRGRFRRWTVTKGAERCEAVMDPFLAIGDSDAANAVFVLSDNLPPSNGG